MKCGVMDGCLSALVFCLVLFHYFLVLFAVLHLQTFRKHPMYKLIWL